MLSRFSKWDFPHVKFFSGSINVIASQVIGSCGDKFIDGLIKLAFIGQGCKTEVAIVFETIAVAFLFNFVQESCIGDEFLESIYRLIPVEISFLDSSFQTDLFEELVEPIMQICVEKEVQVAVSFLELDLSHLQISHIGSGWRRQFYLINYITQDFSDFFFQYSLLSIFSEIVSRGLPFIFNESIAIQFQIRDFGLQGGLRVNLNLFCEVAWEFREKAEDESYLFVGLDHVVLIVAIELQFTVLEAACVDLGTVFEDELQINGRIAYVSNLDWLPFDVMQPYVERQLQTINDQLFSFNLILLSLVGLCITITSILGKHACIFLEGLGHLGRFCFGLELAHS